MTYLENDSLRLCAVEPADASAMWEVESDTSQWTENGMLAPFSRENIRTYALTYDADPFRSGQLRLMIKLKGDNNGCGEEATTVGIADIYNISAANRNACVGIYILPRFRGNGFAVSSISLLEKYCAEILNLRHLAAKVGAGNAPSVSLFEKCGYILRGEIPDWMIHGNRSEALRIFTKILCRNNL